MMTFSWIEQMNNKLIIGGAGLGILAIFGGGNLYADQQLKKFYHSAQHSTLKVTTNEYNMGLFSGQAKKTVSLMLDPCQPDDLLSFDVIDHIKRGVTGYNIESRIALPAETEKQLKSFFNNKDPLSLDTQVSWFGKVKLHLHSPEIKHQKDNIILESKGIDFKLNTNTKDPKSFYDLDLSIPLIIATDQDNQFELKNLKLKGDQFHLSKLLPSSVSTFSTDKFRIKNHSISEQPFDLNLENMKGKSENIIKDNKLYLKNTFEIQSVQLNQQSEKGALKFNFNALDIDAKAFEAFYAVVDRNSTTCAPNADKENIEALIKVLEKGVKIESKDNVFAFHPNSQLRLDTEAKFTAGKYDNIDMLIAALPTQLTAEGQITTSKTFINDLLSIGQKSALSNNPAQLDRMIEGMIAQGMLKQNGNQLISKFEYKFGEPRFLNQ